MSKFKTIAFTKLLHSLKASVWLQVLAASSGCKFWMQVSDYKLWLLVSGCKFWLQALDASVWLQVLTADMWICRYSSYAASYLLSGCVRTWFKQCICEVISSLVWTIQVHLANRRWVWWSLFRSGQGCVNSNRSIYTQKKISYIMMFENCGSCFAAEQFVDINLRTKYLLPTTS